MKYKFIQIGGILLTVVYAAFVVWLYWTEPRSFREIPAKATVVVGTYEVDAEKFADGWRMFRAENFRAARDFFAQADAEKRDAKTQFYIAYSFYREGWGRVYSDDALYKQGLEAANRVALLDSNFKSDDEDLKMKTAPELKAELEQGVERTMDDLNPLKIFRQRK